MCSAVTSIADFRCVVTPRRDRGRSGPRPIRTRAAYGCELAGARDNCLIPRDLAGEVVRGFSTIGRIRPMLTICWDQNACSRSMVCRHAAYRGRSDTFDPFEPLKREPSEAGRRPGLQRVEGRDPDLGTPLIFRVSDADTDCDTPRFFMRTSRYDLDHLVCQSGSGAAHVCRFWTARCGF